MSAPLDQSVMDLLRQSAAGPMLDRPVNDVLQEMGLPQLPDLSALPPLPEMPPMPVIDLSQIAKPLTDLASSFGSGRLPADQPQIDPAQLLSQVSSVLQTATTFGTSALQMAMTLWQGAGASSAANKGAQTAKDGAAISAQSTGTSMGVTAAAGTVFQGAAHMSAIIAKFMTSLVASGPFIVTPPGQAFVLAMSTETLAEATAVVAKTRGELTLHSASMTNTGHKVPVTDAPTGVDPMQLVSQLMQVAGPLSTMATTGTQAVQQAQQAFAPSEPVAGPEATEKADEGLAPGAGGGMGGGLAGGGVGAVAAGMGNQLRQLSAWGGGPRAAAGPLGAAGASVPAAEGSGSSPATSSRSGMASGGPGMMPMGGAAGAAGMARNSEENTEGLRGMLVTEQHGDDVVGAIEGVSVPVVGAAEHVSEPMDSEPPDKDLTL